MKALMRPNTKEKRVLPTVVEIRVEKIKAEIEAKASLVSRQLLVSSWGTETEREPDNWNHSTNGGDYWEGTKYQGIFWTSESSCEMTPDDRNIVGYFGETPIVVMIPYFYGNPSVQIQFKDESYINLSIEEWDLLEEDPLFKKVGSSPWAAGFNFKGRRVCPT